MNKNDPSLMLPLIALLAVVLGVNRIYTRPTATDEPVEQRLTSTGSDKSASKTILSAKPDNETDLLFYQHDAFNRNFRFDPFPSADL